MPKFFEVFGINSSDIAGLEASALQHAVCPFTSAVCDGGGNRHQTKITLSDDHKLRGSFNSTLKHVVPAVCSIDYGVEKWVVCPRRLLGFQNEHTGTPETNFALQDHERDALKGAGLKEGIEYGVWSEIYVQYSIADVEIDYHFDFVLAPLIRNVRFGLAAAPYLAVKSDLVDLAKCAKQGGYMSGRLNEDSIISTFPDLNNPIIVEVMTASTSGSNTAAGTNIAAAFQKLVLGEDYQGPGINKRQVWGRMATQLFAKSALAEYWDGKTYWLVQDELLKNIVLTTKLKLTDEPANSKGTINFISMKYNDEVSSKNPSIVLDNISRVKAGISFEGNDTCSDILLRSYILDTCNS